MDRFDWVFTIFIPIVLMYLMILLVIILTRFVFLPTDVLLK